MAPCNPFDLRSCTPRVHLLKVATASPHFHVRIHVGSTEPCGRKKFSHSFSRTLSHVPATSTHGLRRNHTCHSSPCQHKLFSGALIITLLRHHNKHVYHSIKELYLWNLHCFELSGWLVLGVAISLAHRRFYRRYP